jgi:hypothetical protein
LPNSGATEKDVGNLAKILSKTWQHLRSLDGGYGQDVGGMWLECSQDFRKALRRIDEGK